MRRIMWLGLWGSFLLLAGPVYALAPTVIESSVTTRSGLRCRTQLELPAQDSVDSILFFLYGTGTYSVGEGTNPVARPFLAGHSAVLSFDKPGIAFTSDGVQVDWELFAKHRPQDLVDCAEGAMEWVSKKYPDARWIVMGHSAGAATAVDTLLAASEKRAAALERIDGVILHAPPLIAWDRIVSLQMERMKSERRKQFTDAFTGRNAAFFLRPENGAIPLAFHEAMMATEALSNRIQRLVKQTSPTFYVLQGESDTQCRSEDARDCEPQFHSTRVRFAYYDGEHSYNSAAVEKLIQEIDDCLLKRHFTGG